MKNLPRSGEEETGRPRGGVGPPLRSGARTRRQGISEDTPFKAAWAARAGELQLTSADALAETMPGSQGRVSSFQDKTAVPAPAANFIPQWTLQDKF